MSAPADKKLETLAKSRGFPSYAAMVAFYKPRMSPEKAKGTVVAQPSMMDSIMSLHPKTLMDYTRNKIEKARGGK